MYEFYLGNNPETDRVRLTAVEAWSLLDGEVLT